MIRHDEHLAHDGHQGTTAFHATSDQTPIVGTKGRGRQSQAAQSRQIEHAPHAPAAAFGELDLSFPLATLPDLEVQTDIGHHLLDALKARHIAQLGTQHGNCLAPKLGRAFQSRDPLIAVEQLIEFACDLSEIGQGMFELITQHLQAQGASRGGQGTSDRLRRQAHQLLGGRAPRVARSQFSQGGGESLYPGGDDGLGTGIALEHPQGRRTTGIGEDLHKLGEQHHQQGLDLILVACAVVGQLAVQTLQLAVGADQLVGDIAGPCFPTEQQACNGGGVQAVGLGTQAALLGELARLTRMQQTQTVTLLLQKLVQVLAVVPGGFQSNQDALGWHGQLTQAAVEGFKACAAIGQLGRLDHLALIGLTDAIHRALTADINPDHIGEARHLDGRRQRIRCTHDGSLSLTPTGQSVHTTSGRPLGLPPRQSERDLMLDRQSAGAGHPTPTAVTSPIAACCSGGWGTVYGSGSLALAGTGPRGKRRFSHGFHQSSRLLALHKLAASTNYYMRGESGGEWKGGPLGSPASCSPGFHVGGTRSPPNPAGDPKGPHHPSSSALAPTVHNVLAWPNGALYRRSAPIVTTATVAITR